MEQADCCWCMHQARPGHLGVLKTGGKTHMVNHACWMGQNAIATTGPKPGQAEHLRFANALLNAVSTEVSNVLRLAFEDARIKRAENTMCWARVRTRSTFPA